ncbi:MAG TPA: YheO-like PAS domain protein [Firmicutes bacterium]|jgi:predicted transcriptional regulator YheO|nr:YheO-like PAS domain protein [Bacillota bacterium]
MVDFLAEVLGSDAEVVLHDVSNIENSVVAIRNNHISGRKIGAPATNLALKVIKDPKFSNTHFITNYKGVSESGKTFKSSTYFIRNDKQQLIGTLCINIDVEKFAQFKNYLENLIRFPQEDGDVNPVERFSSSVEGITFESIETIIKKNSISPERMSQDEKVEIIKELNNSGVFLLKGSVAEVASQLKVSEATIYRYLSKIKKKKPK